MVLLLENAFIHGEHLCYGSQLLPVHPPLPVVGLESRVALLVVDPIGGSRFQRHSELKLGEVYSGSNDIIDGLTVIFRSEISQTGKGKTYHAMT